MHGQLILWTDWLRMQFHFHPSLYIIFASTSQAISQECWNHYICKNGFDIAMEMGESQVWIERWLLSCVFGFLNNLFTELTVHAYVHLSETQIACGLLIWQYSILLLLLAVAKVRPQLLRVCFFFFSDSSFSLHLCTPIRGMLLWLEVCCFSCMQGRRNREG